MDWHEDPEIREELGDEAEQEFDDSWCCYYCDIPFEPQPYPLPDRKCPKCGLEVDVKASPEAKEYKKITISQRPFDNWHPGVIIAWRPSSGEWYGTRKYFCAPKGPFPPSHKERPTSYYKISIEAFEPLELFLKRKQ